MTKFVSALSEGKDWQDPSPSDLAKRFPAWTQTPKTGTPSVSRNAPPGVGSSGSRAEGFGSGSNSGYGSPYQGGRGDQGRSDSRGGGGGAYGGSGNDPRGGYSGGSNTGRGSGYPEGGSVAAGGGSGSYGGLGTGRQMSSVSSRSSSAMQSPAVNRNNANYGFDDDPWTLLSSGWDTLTTIASTATQTVAEVAQNVSAKYYEIWTKFG